MFIIIAPSRVDAIDLLILAAGLVSTSCAFAKAGYHADGRIH